MEFMWSVVFFLVLSVCTDEILKIAVCKMGIVTVLLLIMTFIRQTIQIECKIDIHIIPGPSSFAGGRMS